MIAVGRIDASTGEEMLAAGEVDFVAMGRQLLADPDTAVRLQRGRPDLVRPCINCFVCVAENFWGATPRCAVNARLGRSDVPKPQPVESPLSIAIIGAGPAGLEAARVAAGRGHRVTLFERAGSVGGTTRFSSVTTPINGQLVDYLSAAVHQAGVSIALNTTVTAATMLDHGADRVIVATGATRSRPSLSGAELNHVLTGDDLRSLLTGGSRDAMARLRWWQRPVVAIGQRLGLTRPSRVRALSHRWMPLGREIVVLGGGLVGVEIAEFLAERKRIVTVIESSEYLGVEMAHPRRWRALHQARGHGVRFLTNADVTEITSTHVSYTHKDSEHEVAADHVIIANEVRADQSLADELAQVGISADVIGDAATVGYIEGGD